MKKLKAFALILALLAITIGAFGKTTLAANVVSVASGAQVVQKISAHAGSGGTSLTVTFPSAPTHGDVGVCGYAYDYGVNDTVTVPSGWATDMATTQEPNNLGLTVFHRVFQTNDPSTVTVNLAGSNTAVGEDLTCIEYTGVDTYRPVGNTSIVSGSSASQLLVTPTVYSSHTSDTAIGFFALNRDSLTHTPNAGYVEDSYDDTTGGTAQTISLAVTRKTSPAKQIGEANTATETYNNVSNQYTIAGLLYLRPGNGPYTHVVTPTPAPTPVPIPYLAQGFNTCGVQTSAKTTINCSLPQAPVSNSSDYLVAIVSLGNSAATITPPSGFTLAKSAAGTSCQELQGSGQQGMAVFIKPVATTDTAGPYTFTFSVSDWYALSIGEVRNVSASSPIDVCAGNNTNNGSTIGTLVSAPTLTSTVINDLPIAAYAPSTSGLTATPSAGWTSQIYNNTATSYMTVDVENAAVMPTVGAKTPSTTFGGTTGSIVYLPAVDILFAPIGTSIATPAPSPTPTPGTPAFQNGIEWSTTFTPYGSTSPWNQRLPDGQTPTIWSGSDAVMAIQFNSTGLNFMPVRNNEAGNNDPGHPVYFASPTNPLITISCRTYCDHTDNGGYPTQVRIPPAALPAAPGCNTQTNCAGDHHMTVVQPDANGNVGQGDEIDFYGVTTPTGNWGTSGNTTISAGAVQNVGSFITGSGIAPNGATTVGGAANAAGLVRANELLAGRINHALFLVVNCAAPAAQNMYPVQNGAATDVCTNYASGHAAPPLGARYWLDYSDAYIASLNIAPWSKALLYALHDYGGYVEDDNSGGADIQGLYFKMESGEMFYAFGQNDPFAGLVASPNSWTNNGIPSGSYTTRYTGADPWNPTGVDFLHHMHILDPCVTQNTCLQNGQQWPTSFQPYASNSIWNTPMSNQTNPTLYPNSDTIIANNMTSTDGQQMWFQYPLLENGSHPIYFAKSTDILVNTYCTQFCGDVDFPKNSNGKQIRIPANAEHAGWNDAQGNGDNHITIVQPDGTEIDTWRTINGSHPWKDGDTITANSIQKVGNFYNGSGVGDPNHSATVGDVALAGGQIRANEALSGTINHALAVTTSCGDPSVYVYPAQQHFDDPCTGGPPNGAHFWSDLTDAQVDALTLSGTAQDQTWQRAILKALHHYGAYLMDSGVASTRSKAPQFQFESGWQYNSFGNEDPWVTIAKNNGWTVGSTLGSTTYTFADSWNPLAAVGGWSGGHIHIVAECYAKQTC